MEAESNLKNFKSQMDSMLSALAQMNSTDKSIAFSLLKNYVSSAQDHSTAIHPSFSDISQNASDEQSCLDSIQESILDEILKEESIVTEADRICLASGDLIKEIPPENELYALTSCANDGENTTNMFCNNCSQSFSSLNELSSHLETYPQNPMSCWNCTKEFSNEFSFKLHFDQNECKKYRKQMKESLIKTCNFCQKIFYNAQHYDRHVSGHKRNNCSLCSALFTNRKHLETHMLETHDARLEKNYFECKFCFKKLSQKRSILKHYKLHHSKQCSVCTLCGKFFDSANELDLHLVEHESKKWTCEPCKQTFVRHQQYLKHLSEHDKYFCITCNMGFSSRGKIASHCKMGHSVRGLESLHKCNECNRFCESKGKLIKHLKTHSKTNTKTHTEKDEYSCKMCKITFNKASSYKEHLGSSWHIGKLISNTDNHSCQLCMKSFSSRNQLSFHYQETHGILQNITRCPFCNYMTKLRANMRRHIDQHTQHRKYICDQCGSCFYTYSCLKEHITCVHSTVRNFSCKICGMSFKLNSGLKRHMASHSEERTKKCHCGQAYKLSTNLKRHQLLAHGRVDSPKNFQRLTKNDYGEYIPAAVQTKKKNNNVKNNNVSAEKTFQLDEAAEQMKTVLPPHHDNSSVVVPLSDCQLMQSVQVFYQNLDFPPQTTNDDNKQSSLLFTPSIDIAHLQLVETMLHAATNVNDPLKQPQDILVDPTTQNLFDRQIVADTDSYLAAGDVVSTLNPSIEVSQMANLDLTSHSNQLTTHVPVSSTSDSQQNLLNSLSDYIIPHQFPFLNV